MFHIQDIQFNMNPMKPNNQETVGRGARRSCGRRGRRGRGRRGAGTDPDYLCRITSRPNIVPNGIYVRQMGMCSMLSIRLAFRCFVVSIYSLLNFLFCFFFLFFW